ncbi:MAG: nuclear transport factor 2 family protein [Actinomycetota bacterium]|nr:nuclear transport factor 2 family protein [Actinomycetota bacterium]
MEPSEELRHVVRRFFDAVHDGDEEAVSRRFSRQPGYERFGSDPAEWWQDGDAATRVWLQQMRELDGGFPWTLVGDVHAMTEGTVGWAGLRAEWTTPTGPKGFRLSCVLHLEHGEWKIVHCHGSVPSSNEEHGFLLTTSVDDIAESVTSSRPDLSATSAPDGTVTIAFTDIEDSTRLNGFLGDERWVEVLRAHNDVLRDATSEFGGTVVKNQGDGFMLAFPSARSAIRCALAIEGGIEERFRDPGSPVRVRIGLHVGEAIREADDFFGHAVAYAARVASSATGGEIVVSSLVHELVGTTREFRFGPPRTVALKGMAGSHRVYPVEAPATA